MRLPPTRRMLVHVPDGLVTNDALQALGLETSRVVEMKRELGKEFRGGEDLGTGPEGQKTWERVQRLKGPGIEPRG